MQQARPMGLKSSRTCPEDAILHAFLTESLPEKDTNEIREHLNHCESCQQQVDIFFSDTDGNDLRIRSEESEIHPWMAPILRSVAGRPESPATRETICSHAADTVTFPDRSQNVLHLGRLDEFEIIHHLASGATGHLFRARDTKLTRSVAVKVLRAELCTSRPARQRFLQEANAIARVNSDHIVKVFDVREPDAFAPYLVMEFIDGMSAQQMQAAGQRPDQRTAVGWICQVLEGLDAAHAVGVVHRDVKPGNILLERKSGRAKLVDFGLARLNEDSFDLTSPGSIAGTPGYMAPEQILDAHEANEVSDVYSVAVVLYELLTGELPFRGSTRMVLHQVLHDEPRPLRLLDDSIPRDLQTICLKAMSKLPAQRYFSAAEFRDDLQRWLNGLPVKARPVGAIGRFFRWKARNPTVARLSVLLVGLVLALVVIWLRYTVDVTRARQALVDRNRDLTNSYQLLQQANERIASERATAVQQAQRASEQSDLSSRVLNQLTFSVQNALADRPEQQRKILEATIGDLQNIVRESERDSSVTVTLAVAFLRLSETFRAAMNEVDAQKCLQRAQQTLEMLSPSFAQNSDVQQCHAWLHLNRAEVAMMSDRRMDAVTELRQCIDICKLIEASEPNRLVTLQSHALANLRLSGILEMEANGIEESAQQSKDYLIQAASLLQQCLDIAPDSAEVRYDLGVTRLQLLQRHASNITTSDISRIIRLFIDVPENTPLRQDAIQHAIKAAQLCLDVRLIRPQSDGQSSELAEDLSALSEVVRQGRASGEVSPKDAAEWEDSVPAITRKLSLSTVAPAENILYAE